MPYDDPARSSAGRLPCIGFREEEGKGAARRKVRCGYVGMYAETGRL